MKLVIARRLSIGVALANRNTTPTAKDAAVSIFLTDEDGNRMVFVLGRNEEAEDGAAAELLGAIAVARDVRAGKVRVADIGKELEARVGRAPVFEAVFEGEDLAGPTPDGSKRH
jgi:hypothetical protein